MDGLSDLELVAQAMTPSTSASAQPQQVAGQTNGGVPFSVKPANTAAKDDSPERIDPMSGAIGVANPKGDNVAQNTTTADLLGGIDLSSLSPTDLAVLQPLIDALRLQPQSGRRTAGDGGTGGGGEGEGEGEDGGEGEGWYDEHEMAEILAQMDAAGVVADELEGRLDRLIEMLGTEEREMGEGSGEGGERR